MKDLTPAEAAKKAPKPSFISRNLVAIVMIPGIIAFHYGWLMLQENKALVSEEEKIDLPIVTGAKYLWRKLEGGKSAEPVSK
ncbi:uncharacterized protein LOC129912996 [Episyrphus balteatus]|uniref:uncharacterized protein LOC129912996 n=1 Tax=Episyrphus balteatus TaxID=286459 RepID=UPI0024867073|nr:uncharacterized protein LOC129912996 [Episyrphus balteatus]